MPDSPSNPSQPTQSLPAGSHLEEFIIERVLGCGGFGITYLARDKRLGRQVVIKENLPAQFCWRDTHSLTVRPRHTEGEDAGNFQYSLESFEREAATLASLDHPGIVKVLRSFEAYGTAYFVMPFVEGNALDEQIRARQASGQYFTEDELGGMLWRVLDALAYLHDRGIYHRDLKPGNILVTAAGEPVLIDFGAARQRLSERSLTVIESAGYTPFEQLQSRGKIGPWSDIYALGATLYKSLTGETPAKAADRAFDDPEIPLSERTELRAGYTSRFLKSIDKAMAPKAGDRFQKAGEWRDWVWKADSHAQPEPVREEPVVAETASSTPPDLPSMPAASNRPHPEAPQSFEKPPRPERSPPPLPGRQAKKTSAASMLAVAAIVIAVFGSVAYLIMPSARAPDGWDPRAAPQEEVDSFATAGVMDAQIEQVARVLGVSLGSQNRANVSATEMAQAFEQLKAFAEKSDSRGMSLLGIAFEYGKGVAKDEAEAVKWYRKAADAGDTYAMSNLGFAFANGTGVAKDETEAVVWFRKAADLGDANAINTLGTFLEHGTGVTKDAAEAVNWYRKAADAGNDLAMRNLGSALLDGTGVTKEEAEAVKWYRKAAELGNAFAMNDLGVAFQYGTGVTKDEAEAVKWYRKAADAGNDVAMTNLGRCYADGIGVPKEEAEAVKWYRRAAELGNSFAMNDLGIAFQYGSGVPKDEAEAVMWFRKASEAGDANGMCKLGAVLLNGQGVTKNEVEAVVWFRKAAELGDTLAMTNLGIAFQYGSGVPKDEAEAVMWFRKAADAGNDVAMCLLGDCYRLGAGVPKDSHRAIDWFGKAAGGEDLHLSSKMQKLVFPQVNFQNATIEEAVEYMMIKSRDLDVTEERGIRWGVTIIVAELTAKQSNAALSLDLKDVPMMEALRYIAELSGMKLKIESQVVLLTPSS